MSRSGHFIVDAIQVPLAKEVDGREWRKAPEGRQKKTILGKGQAQQSAQKV